MRNYLAVAFLALLGSANGQWKAQRHFEEGGTSVNPVYRQTRQLEQYYSAYRNDFNILDTKLVHKSIRVIFLRLVKKKSEASNFSWSRSGFTSMEAKIKNPDCSHAKIRIS